MQRQAMRRLYDVGSIVVFDRFVRCRFRRHKVVRFAKASTVDTASKVAPSAVRGRIFAFCEGTAEC